MEHAVASDFGINCGPTVLAFLRRRGRRMSASKRRYSPEVDLTACASDGAEGRVKSVVYLRTVCARLPDWGTVLRGREDQGQGNCSQDTRKFLRPSLQGWYER